MKCGACNGTGYAANEFDICCNACFGTGYWHDDFDCPDCDHGAAQHVKVSASEEDMEPIYGPCVECGDAEWDEDEAREAYLGEQADLWNDEMKIREHFREIG